MNTYHSENAPAEATFRQSANGATWVVVDGKASRLVCGEIVGRTYPESSEIYTARCGEVTVNHSPFCEGHYLKGWNDDCEHGLSAALCSGPMHY